MRQCDNRAEITAVAQIDRVGIRFGRGESVVKITAKKQVGKRNAKANQKYNAEPSLNPV